MPTRYRVAAPSRAWRPASFGLTGRRRRYDTVSTFFSEIFGLTLKVFGDLSGHSELVVRGSLSDHNLLGFCSSRDGWSPHSPSVGRSKPKRNSSF
jgi:hypothetical protein